MIGRRALLARLGFGAVAAPLAAKQALEATAAELAGVSTSGMVPSGGGQPIGHSPGLDSRAAVRRILQTQELRDEYTSLMYRRRFQVGVLDPDIANKHSFSLAAKITFQRQRNVEREIAEESAEAPLWQQGEAILKKAMGWPFG